MKITWMKYEKCTDVKKITGIPKKITIKEGKTFRLMPGAKKENKNKKLFQRPINQKG